MVNHKTKGTKYIVIHFTTTEDLMYVYTFVQINNEK